MSCVHVLSPHAAGTRKGMTMMMTTMTSMEQKGAGLRRHVWTPPGEDDADAITLRVSSHHRPL